MVRGGSEGVSDQTPRKQEDLRYVFQTQMRVQSAIWKKKAWMPKTFFYFDLTAGSGIVRGEAGSPVIFWQEALAAGLPCRAWFCERDERSAANLGECLRAMGPDVWCRSRVICSDYASAIGRIVSDLRAIQDPKNEWKYGLAYVDPNGTVIESIETISMLSRELPKVDVLANIAAATYKRCRRAFRDEGRPYLADHLGQIGKKHLLVREPYHRFQWMFALATNWADYPEMKSRGFFRVTSPEGMAILDRANLTADERSDKWIEAQAQADYDLFIAEGMCYHCGFKPAEDDFPLRPGGLCNGCDYMMHRED